MYVYFCLLSRLRFQLNSDQKEVASSTCEFICEQTIPLCQHIYNSQHNENNDGKLSVMDLYETIIMKHYPALIPYCGNQIHFEHLDNVWLRGFLGDHVIKRELKFYWFMLKTIIASK